MSTTSRSGSDTQRSQASPSQRTDEAKAAFIASLKSAGQNVDVELQGRAKNIHANAQALKKQENEVDRQTKKLAKEGDSSQKFLDKAHKQLAVFDDLGAKHDELDDELADLEAMLSAIEGQSTEEHQRHQSEDTR